MVLLNQFVRHLYKRLTDFVPKLGAKSKLTSMAGKAEAIARTTTDNFIISFDKLFYLEDLEVGFKLNVNIYILLGVLRMET